MYKSSSFYYTLMSHIWMSFNKLGVSK